MTASLLVLIVGSVVCDVAGQLFFKAGVDRLPDFDGLSATSVQSSLSNPWIAAGLVTYVTELILWLCIMAQAPLSVAFPLASANFLGIALASWLILGERVTRHQWIGAGLISFGVVLVAQSA